MKRFLIFLFGIYLTIFAQKGLWAISQGEVDDILAPQNKARIALGLEPLIWDKKIAISAQKWADTLAKTDQVEHSSAKNRSGRGENIYTLWTSGPSLEANGSDAAYAWIEEEPNYDSTTNTCKKGKVCGHYTQVIWKDTKKIGCGKSTRKTKSNIKIYWVCQYDPAGNVVGERPY